MTDDSGHAAQSLSFQTLFSFFHVSQPLLVYCHQLIAATRSIYLPPHSRPAGGSPCEYIRQNVLTLRRAIGRPTALENKEKRFKTYVRFKTATSALCFMVTAGP